MNSSHGGKSFEQAGEIIMFKEADLIQSCAAAIRAALGDAKVDFNANSAQQVGTDGGIEHPDGEMTIQGPWGTLDFTLESKRRVTTENIRPLIAHMRRKRITRPLMMSEYINPEMAVFLRKQQINFADVAGNIYLNAPPLFVWQHGFKREPPTNRPQRLFQVVGLKILSVLLWEVDAVNLTYRDLADRAGVSLGSIVPVFDDLAKGGFLTTIKQHRQLTHRRELLEQWVLGYAGQLFPRLILKTCRLADGQTIESLAEKLRWHRFIGEVLLGGELAAGLATGYLRPARAAIHLAPDHLATWMGALRLIPDPNGNVDLIERFATGNQWSDPPADLQGIQCANPILLYGELLRIGTDERLGETADLLFRKFIAPRVGEGG
jgi:hypothetical protein